MEMGFAYVLGKPILIMISDFLTYTWGNHAESSIFADPLFDLIVTEVVHCTSPVPENPGDANLSKAAWYQSFWRRNRAALDLTLDSTVRSARKLLEEPKKNVPRFPDESENLIYIELPGLPTEEFPDWVGDVTSMAHEREWNTHICQRHQLSNSRSETMDRARNDLAMASKSKVLILDGNGAEVPSGSAVLVGYALAKQRETLLLYSGAQTTHAHGREANGRNLMLLYGSRRILRSKSDISQEVNDILCGSVIPA